MELTVESCALFLRAARYDRLYDLTACDGARRSSIDERSKLAMVHKSR